MSKNYLKAVFWDYLHLCDPKGIEKALSEARLQNDNDTVYWIMARFLERGRCKDTALQYQVSIMGYCLMTNHVHLLVLPRSEDGMINFMKLLAQRYTQYYNRKYQRSGKLWENRYKIHPVDPELYYVLLKYIEMNPVRIGLVSDGKSYPWSSAPYHILGKSNPTVLADCLHNSAFRYRDFFYEKEEHPDLDGIRIAAQQGKAWGKPLFLEKLEKSLGKIVTPRRRGRPKKEKE